MYFKRIDIQGFKSFAEPVSIEFHSGITCIVGPNGSGKSNISDAIRWVLGEQSAKMLRGGRMEEVIFSGTESRKSRGMAEVTLVIDNNSNILPIDYSEVAITRRMYRSGESGYFINKVPCRLRDIRELIMDTGIGVDGYSIIGQGKIADILSDKPEARREIFEEAAGIVKYKSKKDESEKKLETSKQNLDRVDDIIGEIESRIDGLKEDSIKAKEFIELKDRYKEVEINITLKNVENVSGKNKVIRDDIHKLHQSIEETSEQKKKIDKNIVEYEARNKKLEHTIASHQDKLMSLVNEINQLTNKGQLYREKLSVMDRDRGRIEGEISSFKMRKDDEIKEALKITEELRRVEEQHESFQADFNSKNEQVSRLEGIIDEMQNSIEEYKAEIYESHSLISGKRSEINSLLSLKETLEKRKVLITQEGKDHNDRRTELGSALQNITDERDRINSTNKSLTHDIENIKGIYNDSLEKEKVLAKELEEKKIAIGQVAARLKLIEEMESAYEGYNEAVKFIMKKNLAGMHGVVADLIRVPRGYEKAIETALGPSLQNIVCDSDVDAKEAIDLLKAKRVGRLTFLPITSIRGFVSPHKERFDKESGYKGLGVDCIKFEGRYEKVMEYLLGRVVIVDKLEDAIRMSRLKGIGGLRFVSLDGDVVNASGAITGGAYRNKTAGLLGRKAEAKALSDKLKEFQKDQKDQTENFEKIREIINSSKESIDELNGKLKKAEMDLLMNENQLERLSAEISNIENLNARKEREIATIKSEEQSADAMVDALKETVKEAENLISQAELKVQSALEEKASKDKKLSEANEELTQIRLIAGKAANEKTNAEQAMKRVQDYIQGYDTEISQRENDLLHIENEKTNLSEENKKSHDALT
ncbi:MAG TPA: chromosome segregation protein SMC, partial [Anaerovoracaceae bacterium]|nr:chromosome segregation protein SMC [Anaerovoracaceae bacterium]